MDTMDKIKVLHIITRLDHGGSSTNTIETVYRLNKEKYQTDLISGRTQDISGEIQNTLEKKNIQVKFINELRREIHPWFDIAALLKLYSWIRKGNYDSVHTHSSKAGILGRWAAKLAGVRIIIHTPHGHVFHGYSGPVLTRVFIFLEKMTAQITDKIITLTDRGKDDHVQFKIAPRAKFCTIHSGIDFSQFHCSSDLNKVRNDYQISTETFLFGSVTRLDPIKGTDILISAMERICQQFPQTKLMIVGEGIDETKLKEQCQSLEISDKVIFVGYQKNVSELMHMMDVFVLPSLNEGMGRVIIEAMACGKPVIASRTGGIPALIEDGKNGVLVPPGDVQALVEAMSHLISLADRGSVLGQKARSKIFDDRHENYSIESMLSKIEKLYSELMS